MFDPIPILSHSYLPFYPISKRCLRAYFVKLHPLGPTKSVAKNSWIVEAKTLQCVSLGDFEHRQDRKVVGTDYATGNVNAKGGLKWWFHLNKKQDMRME